MTMRQPKISDVAKIAGVSTATVSRVLSGTDKVSDDARSKVLEAVSKTGYRVNHAARNLRRNKTGGIVVLVPYLANPFFSRILSAIAASASARGYNVLIVDTRQSNGGDINIAPYLDNNRCDGLIVLDGNLPEAIFAGDHRPPVVFACEWIDDHGYPAVMIDNRVGAEMAIHHLIELGHRKIGHIQGREGNLLTQLRFNGVCDALDAAGLAIEHQYFFQGDFTLESGVAAAESWLALKERPTGVFSASDVMAFGFIAELNRQGVRVPEDVSVVGFDDIEISAQFIPSLTTVHQPRQIIGERAAELLFKLIDEDEGDNERRQFATEVLPVELIIRASTKAPSVKL